MTYQSKKFELSDRRTGKSQRRMEEEAKRRTLKSKKIQNRTRGAPTFGKTLEEATHTNAPNRRPASKITTI
ncbi:hypothetical protein [Gracilimonas sediminicola]|uniref:hypothetical protein n=1 Tax=Gracilimonas sediminicola TaxID=2952158 RepID=UPI0038D38C53